MELQQYQVTLNELETCIAVGKDVSQRLVGTQIDKVHQSYADPIFTKLLCHATSLQKLSPQLGIDEQLWDMPSACAVARCIIEAHDVLEYIVFSEIPDEERTFRMLVWQLHAKQRRSKMLHAIQSSDPRASEIHADAQALTQEVKAHACWPQISQHIRQKIGSGDAPAFLLSQKERNAASGVNHDYHVAATMMLSQYVHTLPMSVQQLVQFKAGTPDALMLSALPIQRCMGFLTRAITRMATAFPHGRPTLTKQQARIFANWKAVIENGVGTASY